MATTALVDLTGTATLRGRFGVDLDAEAAERLGRALGTLARRRQSKGRLLVGRTGKGARAELRDGLVRGLVLCGYDTVDVGVTSPEAFAPGLKELSAAGGVLLQAEAQDAALQVVIFFLDKGPLVGGALHALAALADQGDFAAGAGTLVTTTLEDALRSSRAPAATGFPPSERATPGDDPRAALNTALSEPTISDDED